MNSSCVEILLPSLKSPFIRTPCTFRSQFCSCPQLPVSYFHLDVFLRTSNTMHFKSKFIYLCPWIFTLLSCLFLEIFHYNNLRVILNFLSLTLETVWI